MSYADLLRSRAVTAPRRGLSSIPALHPGMFHYQRDVTEYLLSVGSGAAFLDTGLGKSLVALEWGRVMGLPEYLLIFRKWAKDGEEAVPVTHTKETFPVEDWQQYASPVWNYPRQDLPETDVLNVKVARSDKDEKHLCPMPLNITRRALRMWSNRGDVVFSPFMGIGSEGVVSIEEGRKFIGTELNPAYYRQAVKNIGDAENEGALGDLFSEAAQ